MGKQRVLMTFDRRWLRTAENWVFRGFTVSLIWLGRQVRFLVIGLRRVLFLFKSKGIEKSAAIIVVFVFFLFRVKCMIGFWKRSFVILLKLNWMTVSAVFVHSGGAKIRFLACGKFLKNVTK